MLEQCHNSDNKFIHCNSVPASVFVVITVTDYDQRSFNTKIHLHWSVKDKVPCVRPWLFYILDKIFGHRRQRNLLVKGVLI